LVTAVIVASLDLKMDPVVPVAGFGWDLHLVLPILALMLRPTVQIAHVSASLLSDELGKRYVTAARGFGHTWRDILRDKALRNILAPLFLTISGSFRLSVAELLLIEWLFSWPGIGGMLVRTLVPPRVVASLAGFSDVSVYFLNPPILSLLLVIFSLLFYLVDTLASLLARRVDPRLESGNQEEASYG
jgi:peptide/nickel transport system permease protein